MPALTDVASGIDALGGVKSVELMNTPKVVKCVMPKAFEGVVNVVVLNVGEFSEVKALKVVIEKKRMEEEERKREKEEEEKRKKEQERKKQQERQAAIQLEQKKKPVIRNRSEWEQIDRSLVEVLVVKDSCCKEEDIRVLDLSGYVKLRELKVGDYCFKKVEELKMIGMKCLERVVIGYACFSKSGYKASDGRDDKRHFYLKNCPKLKSLKIGCFSFYDYSVCEIENVDALEVIEMGELNEVSLNFYYASLELKSILIQIE